ncbi:MAG: hypothetical protein WBZ23_07490, partial [Pseudolabrys sp.]
LRHDRFNDKGKVASDCLGGCSAFGAAHDMAPRELPELNHMICEADQRISDQNYPSSREGKA